MELSPPWLKGVLIDGEALYLSVCLSDDEFLRALCVCISEASLQTRQYRPPEGRTTRQDGGKETVSWACLSIIRD